MRARTTRCGSSHRPPSCPSPATPRWGPAMPGWRLAARPARPGPWCSSDGPVAEELLGRIASVLGIDRADIVDASWADNGPGWVAVLLASAEAVLTVKPATSDLDLGLVGPYPPGSPQAFEVRAFFPKDGVTTEDPVTGSLNASLAPWLLRTGRAQAPYMVSQGTALGRAGRVHVSRDDDGTIWVAGGTVTCIRGQAEL